jgi:hypothetical protein
MLQQTQFNIPMTNISTISSGNTVTGIGQLIKCFLWSPNLIDLYCHVTQQLTHHAPSFYTFAL